MKKVFYMRINELMPGDRIKTNIDKIGGVPTHKPLEFPKYYGDEEYGFVMQIYCDQEKFPEFDGALCWHIYQPVDEGDEPILVEVPIGAELNVNNEGAVIERLGEKIIYYEEGIEPDVLVIKSPPLEKEEESYYDSKIGGAVPEEFVDSDKKFIGWINEYFTRDIKFDDFNFGANIYLFKNEEGKLEMELIG